MTTATLTVNELTGRPSRILHADQIQEYTGLSRRHIFDLEKKGKFPKRILLGARRVGWLEEDIFEWQQERIRASRGTFQP